MKPEGQIGSASEGVPSDRVGASIENIPAQDFEDSEEGSDLVLEEEPRSLLNY